MTKRKEIKFIVFIIIVVVVISFSMSGCNSSKKKVGGIIPIGTYALYENGEIKQTPAEYYWGVYNRSITCLYAEYDFIQEDDGSMYFKCQIEQKQKYLVKYEEETEILSIYLPKEMYTDHQSAIFSDDYVWMNFKKR
ncbi:MAG: hypothetical protein K5923_01135 [Clostridia bacterium]|nr:hypothetical protein [Clostridia bacterium]